MASNTETPGSEATEALGHGDFFGKAFFELDFDDLTLGDEDHLPQEITESMRDAFIEQARGWHVSAQVNLLRHGTFQSQPASLLGLKLNFSSPGAVAGGWSRMAEATITVTFHPAKEDEKQPVAKVFTPLLARSEVTPANMVDKERRFASVSPHYATISLGREVQQTAEYAHSYQQEIIGSPWSSKRGQQCDSVVWQVNEHQKKREGISRIVQTAVVFTHESQTVHATVEVKVQTPLGLSLLAFPWPRKHWLLLNRGVEIGLLPADIGDFDALADEQFSQLVALDRPVEIVTATNRAPPPQRK